MTGHPSGAPRSVPAGTRTAGNALLLVLCVALFLDALDLSVVGVALPSIQSDLHLETATLQWVVSGYTLGYGGFLLLGGRAADLLGRRRVFLAALAVFALGSLLGGLVDDGTLLIAARFMKGVGAAFTAPAALSIITTTYPEGPERSRALGFYSATGASGFSLGLVLGGVLTSVSWRFVFFLPVPIALGVLLLARKVVPRDTPASHSSSYDVAGAVTGTAGLLMLVYTVTQAPDHGWGSPRTLLLGLATVLLLGGFLAIESRAAQPLLPLGVFRNRNVSAANATALAFFGAYAGFQFIATLYLQDLLGWSALKTAMAFLPAGLLVATLSPRVGPLVDRFGSRPVIVVGMASMTTAYLLFTRIDAHPSYVTAILPSMLLIGIGCAAAFTSINIAGVSGVRDADQGLAGGLVNTSFQAGAGIVLAAVTAVVTSGIAAHTVGTGAPGPDALLAGYHHGLLVIGGVAAAGLVVALVGFGRRAAVPDEVVEAYPAATGAPSLDLSESA